ncbi:TPA: ferredoxin [Candidatus Sumerlaeota bacterium]|jgi:Na+-translocating ferredoxin:NAD+ oxidoreductase subunit B|nr:ferredoxin [Candidatus Sumerlaeota bacterium]
MSSSKISRESFLKLCGRALGFLLLGGISGGMIFKTLSQKAEGGTVWQIDPSKCTQCGLCATNCVKDQSAVRCMHTFGMCGYCDLCMGYFEAQPNALTEAAENQICPTGAIKRRFVEEPYFEYTIDEALCLGCARCVKNCTKFGNSSLYLQIRQDLCVQCNQCNIAVNCPSHAITRVPAAHGYTKRMENS